MCAKHPPFKKIGDVFTAGLEGAGVDGKTHSVVGCFYQSNTPPPPHKKKLMG